MIKPFPVAPGSIVALLSRRPYSKLMQIQPHPLTASHRSLEAGQSPGGEQIVNYDPLLWENFHDLFRKHIPSTFRCFESLSIEDSTPAELGLSMAAIGALFCRTEISNRNANWLHKSASLLLAERVRHDPYLWFQIRTKY
jgi:hypothetical protein